MKILRQQDTTSQDHDVIDLVNEDFPQVIDLVDEDPCQQGTTSRDVDVIDLIDEDFLSRQDTSSQDGIAINLVDEFLQTSSHPLTSNSPSASPTCKGYAALKHQANIASSLMERLVTFLFPYMLLTTSILQVSQFSRVASSMPTIGQIFGSHHTHSCPILQCRV